MLIFQLIIYLNKFYVTLHLTGTPGRLFIVHDHVTVLHILIDHTY